MFALEIYAGPRAKSQIEENGLDPAQFSLLVGASGGPKWFVLYGLDRFLFGEYFASREKPLMTLGSSVGAWRLCCLGTRPFYPSEAAGGGFGVDLGGRRVIKKKKLSARG